MVAIAKATQKPYLSDQSHLPSKLKTSNPFAHLIYGPYILLPFLTGIVWFGGLLALIGIWAREGTPRYQQDEGWIVFISDVGAVHQKVFIGICATTAGLYVFTMFAERWLRHVGRIPEGRRKRETIYDLLSLFFCIIAAAALISTAANNAFIHSTAHWSSAAIFVLATAISAIFQSLEIFALQRDHPDRAHLKRLAIAKLIIVGTAVAVAIVFAVMYSRCNGNAGVGYPERCFTDTSVAAVMEWVCALILAAYFFTLCGDLWPSGKSSPRYLRKVKNFEIENGISNGSDAEMVDAGRRAYATPGWENGAAVPVEPVTANHSIDSRREMLPHGRV